MSDTSPSSLSGLDAWYATVAQFPTVERGTVIECDPAERGPADRLVADGPRGLYRQLIGDQEGATTALVAHRVLTGVLALHGGRPPVAGAEVADLDASRETLRPALDDLARHPAPVLTGVLRERAPLALLGDCWLDTVSQPATQPAPVVNRLLAHHWANRGGGDPHHDQTVRRRRVLEDRGVALPTVMAADFLDRARAGDLTAWHATFALALSRLPATYLPELLGMHCARIVLGVDDHLLGTTPTVPPEDALGLLAQGVALGGGFAERVRAGVGVGVALEREHVDLLGRLAQQLATVTLDAQVVSIIARHAPYAGRQHGAKTVGGRPLTEALDPAGFDAVAVMRALRGSRQVKPVHDGDARFLRAIRFGGPMFGIFDEAESEVFRHWTAAVQAGESPDPDPRSEPLDAPQATAWKRAVTEHADAGVRFAVAPPTGDRPLLHRLVNIERFPNTLVAARELADGVLRDASVLFEHGAGGRFTDASWFDYSAPALLDRVDRVYWDKLVDPYERLTTVPQADEVVFGQLTFALGSLIDGTWAHRIGNVGRLDQPADRMLLSIYADEMGRGDVRKNHITLIYRTLQSMGIMLPHIADPAFADQADLPDSLYEFSLYQLALAQFPDSRHAEILGYNLAIEMFGLGEMRMHEIQKLRHHGFDACYEQAHLSIDNISAGHARQSAQIVVAHLDTVTRISGPAAVPREWERIWRGYASFAYFVEHRLRRSLPAGSETVAPSPDSELTEVRI